MSLLDVFDFKSVWTARRGLHVANEFGRLLDGNRMPEALRRSLGLEGGGIQRAGRAEELAEDFFSSLCCGGKWSWARVPATTRSATRFPTSDNRRQITDVVKLPEPMKLQEISFLQFHWLR